ncbi:MAG TPA: penicillin-binding transpeptidase domain-containing protein [Nocardioidaceae bacterium]|nr:penicillin-binding transpeptidase domain-containing protein [Nocardioidaceae bacterium]
MNRRVLLRTGAAATAVLLLASGCTGTDRPPAKQAATAFATALSTDHLTAVRFTNSTGRQAQHWWDQAREGMGEADLHLVVGGVRENGNRATARLTSSWALPGHRTWTHPATLHLRFTRNRWAIVLSPAVVGLRKDEHLALTEQPARRADILGAGGVHLVTDRPVLRFGIDKTQVRRTQQSSSARQLAHLLGIDASGYAHEVDVAGDKAFVEAIVLRTGDVPADVRAGYRSIPGARALPDEMPLAPTHDFARAILGTVGPVTAEILKQDAGTYTTGDVVGLSGLEQRYDEQLRGTPGTTVQAVNGTSVRTLYHAAPRPGTPLQTTLDEHLQSLAERALAGVGSASALVAIRPSTGDIVAAVSGPGSQGYATATLGRYAPGSTFKVVSALALLRSGLSPHSPVACPSSVVVNGKRFTNYSDFPPSALGRITLERAFADSCNTAFVGQHRRVSPEEVSQAAAALGIGVDHDVGFPSYFGSVPADSDPTTHAADMIGQGHVLASPMAMAAVAASVRAGHTVVPTLLTDTQPTAAPQVPLTGHQAEQLQQLMAAVVSYGTGTVLGDLPGGQVLAKTGTAEFGTTPPLATHAWMIASQGDLAVAVFVDVGESGSHTAGPILEQFLRAAR